MNVQNWGESLIQDYDWVKVSPVKHDTRPGRSDKVYTFHRAYVDDFEPDDVGVSGVDTQKVTYEDEDAIIYQYNDKPPVIITERQLYSTGVGSRRESEMQAYFAMNILDSLGYVGGWNGR